MTWEIITWNTLTWEISTWIHLNLVWDNWSFIWNAMDFYKDLFSWILPLLKQIWFRLVIVIVVFFVLLFVFNYLSSKGRSRIQKDVKEELHRRNREEYERRKKEKENKQKEIIDNVNLDPNPKKDE